jgi:hypothetical protein
MARGPYKPALCFAHSHQPRHVVLGRLLAAGCWLLVLVLVLLCSTTSTATACAWAWVCGRLTSYTLWLRHPARIAVNFVINMEGTPWLQP